VKRAAISINLDVFMRHGRKRTWLSLFGLNVRPRRAGRPTCSAQNSEPPSGHVNSEVWIAETDETLVEWEAKPNSLCGMR
jgi:hypothetical protein